MTNNTPNFRALQGPIDRPLHGFQYETKAPGAVVSTMQEYRLPEPVKLEAGDLLYMAINERGLICGYILQRADGTVERHIDPE